MLWKGHTMKSCYLMFDVGGTGIKVGLFSTTGQLIGNIRSFPARAKEDKEIIFSNFASIIQEMAADCMIQGIGMAFPGPFDYQNGISLMKGLDKYDSIYGISIKEGILEQIRKNKEFKGLTDHCPFLFLHDIEAFAIGVCQQKRLSGYEKVMCLCIGTGAGSAFVANGRVIKKAGEGVPSNGWIYSTPFKDSVIDDYVSVRGLSNLTRQIYEQPDGMDGAKLFEQAEKGSHKACSVFEAFGENVSNALKPFIQTFQPQGLVLGGQIAKSFSYFGKQLQDVCSDFGVEIVIEPDTSIRAMEGLYVSMDEAFKDKI